jgi:hypothetical protein
MKVALGVDARGPSTAFLFDAKYSTLIENSGEGPVTVRTLMKQPSGFVPMAMSSVALATVLVTVALFGVVREPDEGATAHIWQLLMAGQVPIIAFFAIKWVPQAPRQALPVLALQAAALMAALAPVFLVGL